MAVAGQIQAPRLTGDHGLLAGRAWVVAIAALLAAVLQTMTGRKTPAGGATALVVAIGIEAVNWIGAVRMLVGIGLAGALGEPARRWLLARAARGVIQS